MLFLFIYYYYLISMVPYEKVDKKNFLTMSAHGVLQSVGQEQIFTHLDKWESEYNMYCRLMRIKSFFFFRIWKAFYVWRKGVIYEKIKIARNYLTNNLFFLNDLLRDALLNIRGMCYKLFTTSFTDTTDIENFELFYFIEAQVSYVVLTLNLLIIMIQFKQMGKLEEAAEKLHIYRDLTKEVILNACHGALLAKGFIVDETLNEQSDKNGKSSDVHNLFLISKNKF